MYILNNEGKVKVVPVILLTPHHEGMVGE